MIKSVTCLFLISILGSALLLATPTNHCNAQALPDTNEDTTVVPQLLWNLTFPRFLQGYYHDNPQYGQPEFGSPTVVDGIVYVACANGPNQGLYALNATTGETIWNSSFANDMTSRPAIDNGIVYINSRNDLYAFDANTGTQLWQLPFWGIIRSAPVVVDGLLFFGAATGNVYALNSSSGDVVWNRSVGVPLPKNGQYYGAFSTPTVVDGALYIGCNDNKLYAYGTLHGNTLWTYTTSWSVIAPPEIYNGVAYFGSADGTVYALNKTNGKKLWNYTTLETENNMNPIVMTPTVADGVVYVGSENNVFYALNATKGTEIWRFTTNGDLYSRPSVINDVIYVCSTDYNVYALNATNGAKIWNYTLDDGIYSIPTITNGILYTTAGGSVYAIGELPTAPTETPTETDEPTNTQPNPQELTIGIIALAVCIIAVIVFWIIRKRN